MVKRWPNPFSDLPRTCYVCKELVYQDELAIVAIKGHPVYAAVFVHRGSCQQVLDAVSP